MMWSCTLAVSELKRKMNASKRSSSSSPNPSIYLASSGIMSATRRRETAKRLAILLAPAKFCFSRSRGFEETLTAEAPRFPTQFDRSAADHRLAGAR